LNKGADFSGIFFAGFVFDAGGNVHAPGVQDVDRLLHIAGTQAARDDQLRSVFFGETRNFVIIDAFVVAAYAPPDMAQTTKPSVMEAWASLRPMMLRRVLSRVRPGRA